MAQYEQARNKAQATERMYRLAGWPVEALGPDKKEKRSALEALASCVRLDPEEHPGKVGLAAAIAGAAGVRWHPWYWSSGDTITLEGLNVLFEGTANYLVDSSTRRAEHIISALERWAQAPSSPLTDNGSSGPATWSPVREAPDGSTMSTEAPFVFSPPSQARLLPAPPTSPGIPDQELIPVPHPPVSDELATLEASLADMMATLSQSPSRPEEVEDTGRPFSPSAVRFDDGSWMARLHEISGWLRLHESLDAGSPEAFARSLSSGLGGTSPEDLLVMTPFPRLTELGAERLRERLERALDLQQAFQDTLESENGSTEAASAQWLNAWEEAQAEEDNESSGPIVAQAEVVPIQDFLGWADDGKLNLTPSYQRGDVWPTADAQLLIESVLRGIPLPSIILRSHEEDGRTVSEVVDGKQRLTSILRFVGKHPRALTRVRDTAVRHGRPDLEELFRTDYPRFKKLWKQLTGEPLLASKEREYYFPFPLRNDVKALSGDLRRLAGKYYCQIRNERVRVADQAREVYEIFERTTAYKLPVIQYREARPEQIHEVFHLYNKQGKHLNAEEIRNALYQRLDLMRALQVAAGDIDDVEGAAPFLVARWDDISSTPQLLEDYDFGKARFKRTKLLSWVSSIVFYDLARPDGAPSLRSTAGQINAFLDRPMKDSRDPLRSQSRILELIALLDKGIDAHSAVEDAWSSTFRNAKGRGPWQELQLVASLVGVVYAREVLGDQVVDRLVERAGTLAERSASEWVRPKKTQTRDQWVYIARTVVGILETLGVDLTEADTRVRERFGASGLAGLAQVAAHDR